MNKVNGEADLKPEEIRGAMTIDEKFDALVEALVEIRELVQYIPEVSDQMQELIAQQAELLEKINDLGQGGDGFQVETFN